MVTVGFLANAGVFALPPWVWWLLGLGCVSFAQYRAYQDVRRDLKASESKVASLDGAAAETAKRRHRLMTNRTLSGEDCFMWELLGAHPSGKSVIENRIFTDCVLRGPAFVMLLVTSTHNYCSYVGGNSPSDCCVEIALDRTVVGAVGIINCTFERCRFENIGFLGDAAALDQIRRLPVL